MTRPAIVRMTKIWAYIRDGEMPTATTLAVEFETTTKTIHRDLECMRDQIGLPIRFNTHKQGWETDPDAVLPWWLLTKEKKK